MTVTLKTAEDIAGMRVAGKLAADVLEMIAEHVKPGVTTEALDRICHDYIVDVQKAIPAPLNYKGFPKSICTSINHVVCHGIPGDKPLKDGDTLNIDVTVIKDGYHGDTSRMFHVGTVPVWAERLSQVTQECMYKAIEIVKPGCRLGDIGEIIQKHAEKNGFSVVRISGAASVSLSANAFSTLAATKFLKSSCRARKSVCELTSRITADLPSSLIAMAPSAATLPAFLAALMAPEARMSSMAFSMSPPALVKAFLQSIMPSPVRSRSSLTNAAVISAIFKILLDRFSTIPPD